MAWVYLKLQCCNRGQERCKAIPLAQLRDQQLLAPLPFDFFLRGWSLEDCVTKNLYMHDFLGYQLKRRRWTFLLITDVIQFSGKWQTLKCDISLKKEGINGEQGMSIWGGEVHPMEKQSHNTSALFVLCIVKYVLCKVHLILVEQET